MITGLYIRKISTKVTGIKCITPVVISIAKSTKSNVNSA